MGWCEIVDALIIGFEFGNDHEHERAHPQRQGGEQRCHAGTIGGDRIDGLFADNSGESMKSAIVAASSLPSVPIRELSELEMLRALMSVTSVSSLVCTPASALSVSRSAVTVVEAALSSWSRVCFD